MTTTQKQPYETPKLQPLGTIRDTTASGSAPGDFCPDGRPRPPNGSCGQGAGRTW